MFDSLKRILSQVEADYADIRYEVKRVARVSFSKDEMTALTANTTDGYVLRVLKNGGFASVTFTRPEDAPMAVKRAMENAVLLGANMEKPVRLASAPVVVDEFYPAQGEDPRKVSLEEKIALTRSYNDIALGHEKVVTTNTVYYEIIREKYFINTEGTQIREDLVTPQMFCNIIAGDGSMTQSMGARGGGSDGFQNIRGIESEIEDAKKIAVDMLKADPVVGGVYNCILNPSMAGLFTHEAFGHFSEADIIERLPAMREKMHIGAKLGNDVLSIIDNPTREHEVGFYKYDDEGVAARPTQLIKNGELVGRLHSRQTAAEFNEPLSGHMIAEDMSYSPIVRMGTIYIEPGKTSLDDLFQQLGDGVYLVDKKGGQTQGDSFTFGAMYGWEVKNGKKTRMLRDLNISGNLYKTLKDITAISSDLEFSKVGGCGKGQTNHRSCMGGPHVIIQNLVVGGTA